MKSKFQRFFIHFNVNKQFLTAMLVAATFLLQAQIPSTQRHAIEYHPVKVFRGTAIGNSLPRSQKIPGGQNNSRSVSCDSNYTMDYAAYNEVLADDNGIPYEGSWYDGTGFWYTILTDFVTTAYGDSGWIDYAGVVYDSLVFANTATLQTSTLPLASSTVYLDSLDLYAAIYGDSTEMTKDSLVIYLYSITGDVTSTNPVKTIVYHGWAQLKQFWLPNEGDFYPDGITIPVQYQFSQGQGFEIVMNYLNKNANSKLGLDFRYEDSCGLVYYDGDPVNTAYPSPLSGTDYWGQINYDSTGVDDLETNGSYYEVLTWPYDCSFVVTQNWGIVPIVTVCAASVTQVPPLVITDGATAITANGATLNGKVDANDGSSTTAFQWGTTTAYGYGTVTANPSPVLGSTYTAISYGLTSLASSTTYHYRTEATNTGGTTYGRDTTFTTLGTVATCTPAAVACITQGISYSQTFTFTMPRYLFIGPDTIPIISVTIDSVGNLPSGLSWSANANPATYAGGASGCYIVSGISNAPCGEYLTPIYITVVTNGGTLPSTLYDFGVPNKFLQVISSGHYCPTVNTAQTASFVSDPSCGAGSAPCTPTAGAPVGITPPALQVGCITQGSSYSQSYTIVVPSTFTSTGITYTITSLTIDSVGNLPSGLSWSANANPATYSGGTSGCYVISGISNAPCGEYLTPVYATIVTTSGTITDIPLSAPYIGIPNQFLQVISSGHSCPVVDTAQTVSFVSDVACGTVAPPSVTISVLNEVNCFGQSTGSAEAVATGGNGTYTYSWSSGSTTATASNLAANTYGVTVTSNSQTATATVTITGPASALSIVPSSTSTGCASNTGTASANASGGTSGYMYHWNNNSTSASLSGLAAGLYSVTVTDAKGCIATGSTTVSQPSGIAVTVTPVDVSCYGENTGSVSANVSGGTGTLNYTWSNGGSAQILNNIVDGLYIVTVTDANSCTASGSATVTQPSSPLTVSATSTETSCVSNTGTVSVTVNGGTTSYNYIWSNNSTSASLSELGVGNYTVTVTDAKGCTATASTTVNTSASFTVNVSSNEVTCYGLSNGSATVTTSGTTGTVIYSWSPSGTTQTISSLVAGTYTVTVKDGSGCSKVGSTTVTQPTQLTGSASSTETACSSNTGTVTATLSGGTPGYTYRWSNSTTSNPAVGLAAGPLDGTITDSQGCTVTVSATVNTPVGFSVSINTSPAACTGQSTGSATADVSGSSNDTYFWSNGGTTVTISNVDAGQYIVTVTDGFGCTATASGSVSQPANGLSLTTSTNPQSSCLSNNGTATVNATNGATPYSYSWSNGQTNSTISNLAAGNYSVTVTDHNGCTSSAVASVSSPATFTISVTTVAVTCYGGSTGSASVTVNGTGSYTYLWNNSITTATDADLPAGTYNVTVTDGNGCSKAGSGVVTQPSAALVANATATSSTCGTSSGTATVTVVGATGSLSYLWSSGQTTPTIIDLSVNVYTVTVTETNQCSATASAVVNNLNGPTLDILSSNPTCPGGNNGSATAVVSGGTRPYTYAWSNTLTTDSITNLTAGTFKVIIADSTGCQATGSIILVAPSPFVFNPSVTDETCNGNQNGSIDLALTGGTSPYIYSWSNNNTTPNINNLGSGNFAVTVTDADQCTATSSFAITQPNALQVTFNTSEATHTTNGSATALVNGGTPPYQYTWINGATTETDSLGAGSYSVTVTDSKNCSGSGTVTIVLSGVEDIANNITGVTLIPNPASDLVKVVVDMASAQTVEFRMADVTGKYIYSSRQTTAQGRLSHEINLGEYAAGIYLIEISAGDQVIRKRLIIAR